MVAGEYSVLIPGQRALLLPTEHAWRFAAERAAVAEFSSDAWTGPVSAANLDPETQAHVRSAYLYGSRLLSLYQRRPIPHRISIQGPKLTWAQGAKGLGSSSAVVTGVLKTMLKVHGLELLPDRLFKVSWLAHAHAQGQVGSGCDLAVQIAAGPVLFTSLDRSVTMLTPPEQLWLDALETPWDHRIDAVTVPFGLQVALAPLAQTVTTAAHIARFDALPREVLEITALARANQIVIDAWMRADVLGLVSGIKVYQAALFDMAKRLFPEIGRAHV